jgi:hypothetical protein
MRRSGSISYPAEDVESNFGSPVCERGVRGLLERGLPVSQFGVTGCRAGVGRVLSSVAAGHSGGTRSALDRFRETSIVDRRVTGDVHQMGHSKIETTKNIYGHLFAQDRALILDAMNQAVSRLYAYENEEPGEGEGNDAVA